jgi:hypothetical protein
MTTPLEIIAGIAAASTLQLLLLAGWLLMQVKIFHVSGYLYRVAFSTEAGIWLDAGPPMPLCDARDLARRVLKWSL